MVRVGGGNSCMRIRTAPLLADLGIPQRGEAYVLDALTNA